MQTLSFPPTKSIDLQAITRSILGAIDWENVVTGFCRCPGESHHTHPTHHKDCRVSLNGVPTVYCFHTSCWPAVAAANTALRSVIGKASAGSEVTLKRRQPTPEEKDRSYQRIWCEQLRVRSAASLPEIVKTYAITPIEFCELSPVQLIDDPANDWRLLLQLFIPEDIVWIGGKFSSCNDSKPETEKIRCRRYFRKVADWLQESAAPEQLICPSVFKPGTYSRCNAAVFKRRFLVIESDLLSKSEMLAVIRWCSQFMKLRATVDTGGKSLHGWFDPPLPEMELELRTILPNLGRRSPYAPPTLDPALFKVSQPCRLPGAWRESNKVRQSLLYLDLEP